MLHFVEKQELCSHSGDRDVKETGRRERCQAECLLGTRSARERCLLSNGAH